MCIRDRYQAASEVADGEQTETNAILVNGKALLALVHVRRQHGNIQQMCIRDS